MTDVFLEPDTTLNHEIAWHSTRVPMRIVLRCRAVVMPQFGPGNIQTGPVTCMACIGWVDPTHDMFCVTRCSICVPGRVSCDGVAHSCWCFAQEDF